MLLAAEPAVLSWRSSLKWGGLLLGVAMGGFLTALCCTRSCNGITC